VVLDFRAASKVLTVLDYFRIATIQKLATLLHCAVIEDRPLSLFAHLIFLTRISCPSG
jgi:hypothetical protein